PRDLRRLLRGYRAESGMHFTRPMRRLALLILLLVITFAPARAQHVPEFSGGFTVGVPMGPFARHLSTPAFGFGGLIGTRLSGLPITLGLDGAIMLYGLDVDDRPFHHAYGAHAITTQGIAMGHLVVRVQDASQPVSPYADVLVGAKYLYTETHVDGEPWAYAFDRFHDSVPFDDLAFSYGMGGGVQFRWMTAPLGEDGPAARFSVHLGVRYLFGSKARFLQPGASFEENGEVYYETETSRTDMVVPHLGFSVLFR
ncbi:MAG TPA: hypothetical protein VF190_07400, partial [Rhodothermales bacterium]